MDEILQALTRQLAQNGIELNEIKPAGITEISGAYLDAVAGGLPPGTQNFWLNDSFIKNLT